MFSKNINSMLLFCTAVAITAMEKDNLVPQSSNPLLLKEITRQLAVSAGNMSVGEILKLECEEPEIKNVERRETDDMVWYTGFIKGGGEITATYFYKTERIDCTRFEETFMLPVTEKWYERLKRLYEESSAQSTETMKRE